MASQPNRTLVTSWCLAVIAFGAVLALAAFPPTDGPARLVFAWQRGPLPSEVPAYARVGIGLMGAVTVGWGLTMLVAVRAAHALGAQGRPLWRALTAALLAWFVIDNIISAATGYGLNIVSNTVLMAAWLGIVFPALRAHQEMASPR